MLPARSPARRTTSRRGGADERRFARGGDAQPERRAVVNRRSPIPTTWSRRGFLGPASDDPRRQWHERNSRSLPERYLLPRSRPRSPNKQPHFFSVFGKKFDARFFQCVANSFHSLLRNLPTLFFEIYDSRQAQCSSFCKLRLGHVQHRASCSTLRRGHRINNFC
jgi:hypothetical protein